MKKITIITDSYYPATGGAESAAQALAKKLSNYYNIEIIYKTDKKLFPYRDNFNIPVFPLIPSFLSKLLMQPLKLWGLPFIKRFGAKKIFDFLYIFYKIGLKKNLSKKLSDSDLIVSYSVSYLAILTTEISQRKKIPLIHIPLIHFGRWGDSPLQIKSYFKADVIICPTESFKKQLLEFNNKKLKSSRIPIVIPHIIPKLHITSKRPNLPKNISSNFMLFLGRDEKHKGLSDIIEAFVKYNITTPLIIAGDDKRASFESKNILNLGRVAENEKLWLLKNCKALVFPSTDESFGIVLAEALSCGKPVIAYDIEPINEIIVDNTTGILVEKNSVSNLAKAIIKMNKLDDNYQTLCENSMISYSKKFSEKIVSNKYIEIIKKILLQ